MIKAKTISLKSPNDRWGWTSSQSEADFFDQEFTLILAWVISLLLLCASLIIYIERLGALRIVEINTMVESQKKWISAEKAVQACEENITALSQAHSSLCFTESLGNQRWLISSKETPGIQIGDLVDETTGIVTRINWRQIFE
ncbi:hypothetical protein [Polynucleobacter necessarius]|uniref:hypothetical protein n=1 Tax=Polynucleobacter necessarius TaxID=576610 RepID=UPI001E34BE0D|nr:hypothetical protein [Polynucleobacter necessarius]